MEKNSKIYLAGHRGLVGGAIFRRLKKEGFNNIITKELSELDLCNQSQVEEFYEFVKKSLPEKMRERAESARNTRIKENEGDKDNQS